MAAWNNKGIALFEMGYTNEALDSFKKAIDISPTAGLWNNKGIVLDKIGFQKKALEAYNKAINYDPDLSEAWSNKGIYWMAWIR